VILSLSTLTALAFLHESRRYANIQSLFTLIQNIFAYIAPPFAVIFTLGVLWRRATGAAALITIFSGFVFTMLLDLVIFPKVRLLEPYNSYQNRAILAWIFCMITMIVASWLTEAPPPEKTDGIIWSRRYALLPPDLQRRYRGLKDFRLWWALYIVIMAALYGAFLYNRLKHPINMINGWPRTTEVRQGK
jgi:SSS family solute:Na+ symporter